MSDLSDPGEPPATADEPLQTHRSGAHARSGRRGFREWLVTRPRRFKVLLGVLGAVVLIAVGAIAWYEIEANPLGGPGRAEVVTVREGESTGSVVDRLATQGVVSSSLAFQLSLALHGAPTIQPGDYLMHQNLSFSTVRALLSSGPNVHIADVYPGYTLGEIAQAVGELPGHSVGSFTKAIHSGAVRSPFSPPGSDNLEGLVGSGTYQVLPGESDRTLLERMVQRFDAQAAEAGFTPASAAALGLTPYQVVTAASIVQKEGYIAKNMGPVARVIYNRLANNMELQMNSTVLYSLGQDGGPVTPADLKLDTPYNTYLHAGLTPTPIDTPSVDALKAAVSPPPGQWLYFVVVKKDGTEAFSDTYAQQLANENLAQSRGVG